ncbi:hypothetical protein BJ138DRAFT_308681 [Hygrophoropsis aurantiaca]|uniref:Uncharacterized protein n=1 Tax=Hygrophoropsis aurantiaca TaxID=72124 RepID=A0ACB8A675_9AGAM|nr:hypothetical protein BJ138DRAFT_308681 [Hygrophoropsis aurantiaca]
MPSPVTSQSSSGYTSPAASSSTSVNRTPASKVKPTNVFSNDGSFLERIQRNKKEEEEKKKQEDALTRKRQFDDRFKKRGKRPPPDSEPEPVTSSETPPAKRSKPDEPLTDYQKQVRGYAGRSLKDTGTGVRPLVK